MIATLTGSPSAPDAVAYECSSQVPQVMVCSQVTERETYDRPIAGIAPEVSAGYRQVRAAIETDGALTASFKALVSAVCASVLGNEDLAARELARGREVGLDDEAIGIA